MVWLTLPRIAKSGPHASVDWSLKRPVRISVVVLMLLMVNPTFAQRAPHLAYAYPAGGQRGTTVEVAVGGQHIANAGEVILSGEDVSAEIIDYVRPLNGKEVRDLRENVSKARQRVNELRRENEEARRMNYQRLFHAALSELGVAEEQYRALMEYNRDRSDPKRQVTPQLDEQVVVKLTIDRGAPLGPRELRVITNRGVSNTVRLHIGQFPEVYEHEPDEPGIHTELIDTPTPVVINGQVMPGDVDRFRFYADRGERLVVDVAARQLVPYLADAVPGWFQATVALYDHRGNELAFVDDFRFQPDPVLLFEAPRSGEFVIEIRDAIYRGREDFVYRITLGKRPYITSIYPLGGREDDRVAAQLFGWNLPVLSTPLNTDPGLGHMRAVSVQGRGVHSNTALYAVGDLPEITEREYRTNMVNLPVIANGRIDRPGDGDTFRFRAKKDDRVVAEVMARRLYSPLDAMLRFTDTAGNVIAVNDDHVDPAAGLMTHHADAYLNVTIPADGDYELHITDAQSHGSEEHAYRLRISAPRPAFELRVTPGAITASQGQSVPITVFALRRDGFDGPIDLSLKDAPDGYALIDGVVPTGEDKVELKLKVGRRSAGRLVRLTMIGTATLDDVTIEREASPAEDMMQAFIYHHLVPTEDWVIAIR